MSESTPYIEKVEDYLLGSLSAEDKTAFESAMVSDFNLKAEVAFQKTIIGGVEAYKAAALKSRLAALPTPPASFFSTTVGKTLVASISTVVIGLTGYFALVSSNEPEGQVNTETIQSELITVDQQTENKTFDWKSFQLALIPVTTKSKAKVLNKPTIENLPKQSTPVIPGLDIEEEFVSDELVNDSGNENSIEVNSPRIDVNIDSSTDGLKMYQFINGTLSLRGDFSESPYEILELNLSEQKSVYLYYAGDYFDIEVTSDYQQLKFVKSAALIKELESYRTNK